MSDNPLPKKSPHRTRHLFIRQQTAVINAIRAHLAEFGIVAPVGRNGVEQLLGVVADSGDKRLPDVARACVAALGAQLRTPSGYRTGLDVIYWAEIPDFPPGVNLRPLTNLDMHG